MSSHALWNSSAFQAAKKLAVGFVDVNFVGVLLGGRNRGPLR
jgi:hypothetical protein